MTRQKFAIVFIFTILLTLFVATVASAQSVPPPAPQGVPCLREVTRKTTFEQYTPIVEDRSLLATAVFSLPVGSESCVATYQVIYGALTGAVTMNPTLECAVKDQLTQMFGYCTGVISGTARADFFVSQKFHGSELKQLAVDTETNWTFDASQVHAANARVGNWKNAPQCTMVVRRYWYFTEMPGRPEFSFLSNVRWNKPGQVTEECYYAYQINSQLINSFQEFGDAECAALDGKTVFCVGYTNGSGGVDIGTYGQLNGAVPFSATDYVFSDAHTWVFFGRAIFLPNITKT